MLWYHHSKVRGTTFNQRQKLLRQLCMYDPKDILLFFKREPCNPADSNAIAVVAAVRNKGKAIIGYVSKAITADIAPLLDVGKQAIVVFEGITGGYNGKSYGCNFKFIVM